MMLDGLDPAVTQRRPRDVIHPCGQDSRVAAEAYGGRLAAVVSLPFNPTGRPDD